MHTANASKCLAEQVALVTGGSSGIGAAVAIAFAQAGASVAINYHGAQEHAVAVAEKVQQISGETPLLLRGDVGKEADVQQMFHTLVERHGRLDILVANAGLQQDAPVAEMTLAHWQKVIDTNLTGAFLCAREAIRLFVAQGASPNSRAIGKILCMSSVHQQIPWGGHVNYATSKGGMMLMMQTLAQEVGPKKIRINGIAPGAIKTPINESVWSDPAQLEKLLKLIPYGRIGEPDDVAKAAVWLASDAADYVHGTTLFIDGGMTHYPGFGDNG